MANEIVFYVTDRGNSPVLDFIGEQNEKEQAKITSYLCAQAERGNSLPAS